MAELLLPYAYDSDGKEVHIDNAVKGQKYTCPECGEELLLRLSKIPEGQKYHRRNHFAHKSKSDNNCSESYLHKRFKELCAEFVREKILNKESFGFCWECEKCGERHKGNLLKKAVDVSCEYDLGVCRPDIALLDSNGNVVIVIEVVVTHKPEAIALEYYEKKKIACLQIKVSNFEECDCIAEKLQCPNDVNICPTPICNKCGEYKRRTIIHTINAQCIKCGTQTKIAIKSIGGEYFNPSDFNESEIKIAKDLGANVKKKYSKTFQKYYYVNECLSCKHIFGRLCDYHYSENNCDSHALDYECPYCEEERILKDIEGYKKCPLCHGYLRVRTGPNGNFWGCENYSTGCRYTESIRGLGWDISDNLSQL